MRACVRGGLYVCVCQDWERGEGGCETEGETGERKKKKMMPGMGMMESI